MDSPLGTRTIFRTWWPLAASWLLMSIELPLVSAFVARMSNPEIQLAAFGGVVFPVALVIEGPVIMMLAAATALAERPGNLKKLWIFAHQLGFVLTLFHALVAFTPLHDLIAVTLIGVPPDLVEPSRLGIQLMLPWSWLIADRRFHQGVLIRHERSVAVGIGTAVRLVATLSVLLVGYHLRWGSGVALACSTLSFAVFAEAVYARWAVRDIGWRAAAAESNEPVISGRELIRFYLPLALSPLVALVALPIGSAGISRMPESLRCLAVWPALNGLSFASRSVAVAYNEVVVTLANRRGAEQGLLRFSVIGGFILSGLLLLLCVTPLSSWWFGLVMGLEKDLVAIGVQALWYAVPLPALTFVRSVYQGRLVAGRETRGVTEAVIVQVASVSAILLGGVVLQGPLGADVAMLGFTLGTVLQVFWLWWRVKTDLDQPALITTRA
jgi:hypothetical protein